MTAITLAKKIRKRIANNKARVDAGFPPDLSGSDATDFVADANGARDDCTMILADAFFSGITPDTKTQPVSASMMNWYDDMAGSAQSVVDDPSPTAAETQDAADSYNTIAANTADLIDFYT